MLFSVGFDVCKCEVLEISLRCISCFSVYMKYNEHFLIN